MSTAVAKTIERWPRWALNSAATLCVVLLGFGLSHVVNKIDATAEAVQAMRIEQAEGRATMKSINDWLSRLQRELDDRRHPPGE